MLRIPFLDPESLQTQDLPVPQRPHTADALASLKLDAPPVLNDDLRGYRALYRLDRLEADFRQGFVRAGGFRIHVQVFLQPPSLTPKGTVWLLHGYMEHAGLAQPLIEEVLRRGFQVVVFDWPGHGLSDGAEATIAHFDDYQRVLDGVRAAVQGRAQLPAPWLGIGQSLGGGLWMQHILRALQNGHTPMIERVLLVSPLVRAAGARWLSHPWMQQWLTRQDRALPRLPRRTNRNPAYQRYFYKRDPLRTRTFGTRWVLAMTQWSEEMEALPACNFPVWLAQGERDPIVDWRYNQVYVRRQFRIAEKQLLPHAGHQLINERADFRAPFTEMIPAFLRGQPPGA